MGQTFPTDMTMKWYMLKSHVVVDIANNPQEEVVEIITTSRIYQSQ